MRFFKILKYSLILDKFRWPLFIYYYYYLISPRSIAFYSVYSTARERSPVGFGQLRRRVRLRWCTHVGRGRLRGRFNAVGADRRSLRHRQFVTVSINAKTKTYSAVSTTTSATVTIIPNKTQTIILCRAKCYIDS